MDWYESVVRINNGIQEGTGFFVKNDLIITAAHVVQPDESNPLASENLTVTLPKQGNQECVVLQTSVNPLWTQSQKSSCDMAFLRVDQVPGLGIVPWLDFWSTDNSYEIGLFGYPAGVRTGKYTQGFLKQEVDASYRERYILFGQGFEIAPGMSGGPFLFQHENGIVYAVGIATWDLNEPTKYYVFNGVPFDRDWQEFIDALNE